MTVKELIEMLNTVPQESEIRIVYDGPETMTYLSIKIVELLDDGMAILITED